MNREIKFRCWNSVKKEFVNSYHYAYVFSGNIIHNWDYNEWTTHLGNDPIMVQQYIGQKDVNNVDIYDGDIISCYEYLGNGMEDRFIPYAHIIWDGYSWCYSIDKSRNFKNSHQILRYARNPQVIGNIFENPDNIS